MKALHPLIALLMAMAMLSCSDGYHERRDFADGRWMYADSVVFRWQNADTSSRHLLRLHLSIADEYPFNNLYLQFVVQSPGGSHYKVQNEFLLTDSLGSWNASRGWSGQYHFATVLNRSALFNERGTYTFTLRQYMRRDTLPGVHGIGLQIDDAE